MLYLSRMKKVKLTPEVVEQRRLKTNLQAREYYKRNAGKCRAYTRDYTSKHYEQVLAANRKYKRQNKEKTKAKAIAYRKENPLSEEEKKKHKETTYRWQRTERGMCYRMYISQVFRANKRSQDPPNYTKEEFFVWMRVQPNFRELYDAWVASDYDINL